MSEQNLTGYTLGQYQLHRLIGIGGMGSVYEGIQLSLRRKVAIKVLPIALSSQVDYVARFTREAETASSLEHAHIIPVYDFGTQEGISYVVMRLLTGGTLSERMAQMNTPGFPRPSLQDIAGLLKQLASALDYAHSRQVVHRDIKPSNVMFDNQGNGFLVDFGIAKLLDAQNALTGTGMALGTPAYMSPEQWRGEEITPAADQYALGVMTYYLVAGKLPFEAPTPFAMMHKHLNELPTPLPGFQMALPEALNYVLNRAMAKNPRERFQTMTDFVMAFERAMQGAPGADARTTFFTHSLPAAKVDTPSVPLSHTPSQPQLSAPPPPMPTQRTPSGQQMQWVEPRAPAAVKSGGVPWVWVGLLGVIALIIAAVVVIFVLGGGDDPEDEPTPNSETVVAAALTSTAVQINSLQNATESPTTESSATATTEATEEIVVVPPTEGTTEVPPPSETPTEEILPSATNTEARATETPTLEPSSTPTEEPSPTATETPTEAFTNTPAPPTETATFTQTPSATVTPSETLTETPTSTFTLTQTYTSSPTLTPTLTLTPTPTNTRTPTSTRTPTNTRTPTFTRTPTPTPGPGFPGGRPVTVNADWTPQIEAYDDGMEMVLVPIGCFRMGSNDGASDEQPVHEVCFEEPFWIGRYEITNGLYGSSGNWGGANFPRENVTFAQAQSFCEGIGGRLPSEEEWEYAARGPDGLVYPWGNQFEGSNAVYQGNAGSRTATVGSRASGVSWVGALDMTGNVWEWTDSVYTDSYAENRTAYEDFRVMRGGSWNIGDLSLLRSSFRNTKQVNERFTDVGFRCVRSYS